MRSCHVVALLGALLAIAAGVAVGQEVPAGCSCTNNAPDETYTCDQQKEFGKCEEDWMVNGGLCEFACGRCECEDADAAAVVADDAEEEADVDADADADAEEEEDEVDADAEEDEEDVELVKAPKTKKPKRPRKPKKTPVLDEEDEELDEEDAEPTLSLALGEDAEEDEDTVDAVDEEEVLGTEDEEEDTLDEDTEEDALAGDAENLEDFADPDGECEKFISEVFAEASETGIFAQLLAETGVGTELEADGAEYTIFAPTDEAIESGLEGLGLTVDELLETYPEKAVTIAKYHVVEGAKAPADLKKPVLIPTIGSDPLVGGSLTEIEGLGSSARLVSTAVPVCNSVVYLVDTLLLPATDIAGISPKDTEAAIAPAVEAEPDCKEGFDGFFAVSEDPDLTTVTDALNRFSLSERLADADGAYTFLAPTDAAFEKAAATLDIPLEELLNDADTMVGILENHILDEVFEGSDLRKERSAELVSQNGSTIALETNAKGTLIDLFAKGSSAKVIETDIDLACSAAVHKINGVLLPFSTGNEGTVIGVSVPQTSRSTTTAKAPKKPAKQTGECQVGSWSVFEVLNQMPELRVFTSILQQAKLTKIFTNKAIKVTIFAPVDYAFGNILQEGKGFFDLVPEQVLAENMISAHIVGKPVLKKNLEDGMKLGTALTLKNKPVSVEIAEDPAAFPIGLTVSSAAATANITKVDILACNSVIHVVDAVLIPTTKVIPSKTVSTTKAVSASRPYGSLLVTSPTTPTTSAAKSG